MFKLLANLEAKRLNRGSNQQLGIFITILKWMGIAYFAVIFLTLGIGGYYFIEESTNLGGSPIEIVSRFWIYYIFLELVMRFALQKLPTGNIIPLLVLPIKKKKIVEFYVNSRFLSAFNLVQLFFVIPFMIVSLTKGYPAISVIAWSLALYSFSLVNNFVFILMESYKQVFYSIVSILILLITIHYFDLFDITIYSKYILYSVYLYPYLLLIPLVGLVFSYKATIRYYLKNMYLDNVLENKVQEASSIELKWLDNFGTYSTFLKNDIRLILRNKRAKTTLYMSVFFMFYGFLVLTPNSHDQYPAFMMILVAFFVSGGFLMLFGQYVPSWDSSYYPFMMTQNITYKDYLKSKWLIIALATALSSFASFLYIFKSMELFYLIWAMGIFNIGVNTYMVLWAGAYLKSPVDLTANKNVFADKNAFNLQVILLSLPKLLLPLVVYYLGSLFYGFWGGFTALIIIGIIGMFIQNKAFDFIAKIYKKEKYSAISAFKK
ncbi:DUF5687 family protein [Myroides sp. LJL115]